MDVIDFFGRDEALACLCFACAEMLSPQGRSVKSKSPLLILSQLIASFLAEKYTRTAPQRSSTSVVALPIRQLRKVEESRATRITR